MPPFNDRSLVIAIDGNGVARPVRVDGLGNLVVVGGGVETGSQVQLVDAVDLTRKLIVTADGKVNVGTVDSIIGTVGVDGVVQVSNMIPAVETGLAKETTVSTLVNTTTANTLGKEQTLATLLTSATGDTLGKQITLTSILAEAVATNGHVDGLEGILTVIRDTVYRRTDQLPTGTNRIGFVQDYNAFKFCTGLYRVAGDKLALAANSPGTFLLRNPTGSGRTITITEFYIQVDQTTEINYWRNSTIPTPTSIQSFNPNTIYADSATVAVCERQAVAPTAGTRLSPITRIATNDPVERGFVYTLVPGESIAFTCTASTLTALNVFMSLTWIEDPL